MDKWAKTFYPFVIASRVNPVGQQDYQNFPVKVYPERRSGKTKMTDAVGREIPACAGVLPVWRVEAQGPGVAFGETGPSPESFQKIRGKQWIFRSS